MELFWIIVGYTVVLAVCFLAGEYLQDKRITKRREKAAAPKPQPEPGPSPAEPEVLPHPRQTAQTLSRDLEQLAKDLADSLGLEQSGLEGFFASGVISCPPKADGEVIDLEAEEQG